MTKPLPPGGFDAKSRLSLRLATNPPARRGFDTQRTPTLGRHEGLAIGLFLVPSFGRVDEGGVDLTDHPKLSPPPGSGDPGMPHMTNSPKPSRRGGFGIPVKSAVAVTGPGPVVPSLLWGESGRKAKAQKIPPAQRSKRAVIGPCCRPRHGRR